MRSPHGTFRKDAERLFIQHVYTRRRTEHEFPVSDLVFSGCWMGHDRDCTSTELTQ